MVKNGTKEVARKRKGANKRMILKGKLSKCVLGVSAGMFASLFLSLLCIPCCLFSFLCTFLSLFLPSCSADTQKVSFHPSRIIGHRQLSEECHKGQSDAAKNRRWRYRPVIVNPVHNLLIFYALTHTTPIERML